VRSGELGEPVGVHMKIVNTGRGGWDVLPQSYVWQFEQTRDGRGMLVFDHGWHQLAVAIWLFGPITRIFGWIGETEVAPGYALDAPASLVWEHATGLRGGLDLTLATDTYFRSDFYSCDERVEVTCGRGSVRCNRISAFGRQEPSVQVYRDGEVREYHALPDGGDAGFAASAAAMVAHLHGEAPVPDLDADTTEAVMRALVAALDSSRLGRPVDVTS
jgi:predicted dehydrogenase